MKYILLPAMLFSYFVSNAQDNHQASATPNDKKNNY